MQRATRMSGRVNAREVPFRALRGKLAGPLGSRVGHREDDGGVWSVARRIKLPSRGGETTGGPRGRGSSRPDCLSGIRGAAAEPAPERATAWLGRSPTRLAE